MGNFKLSFLLLLLLNIDGLEIPCASGGGDGLLDGYLDVFSAIAGNLGPIGGAVGSLSDGTRAIVDMFSTEDDCLDELVEELKKVFVTNTEFVQLQQEMGEIVLDIHINTIEYELEKLSRKAAYGREENAENDRHKYVTALSEYVDKVGDTIELMLENAETLSEPIQKFAALSASAIWMPELEKAGALLVVFAIDCYERSLGCTSGDLETYKVLLTTTRSRIWRTRELYLKIEQQLYDYRNDVGLLRWTYETQGISIKEYYGQCATGGPGPNVPFLYRMQGGSCAYESNAYLLPDVYESLSNKWESAAKEWDAVECPTAYSNDPDQWNYLLCKSDSNGYPKQKKAQWLADEQRINLMSLYSSGFFPNGNSILTLMAQGSCRIHETIRTSPIDWTSCELAEFWFLKPSYPSFHWWGRRRSLEEDEEPSCDVNDFTDDEISMLLASGHGLPVCMQEPPMPLNHISYHDGDDEIVNYVWVEGGFGACGGVTCGTGTQTQTVRCYEEGHTIIVDDENCSGDKPDSSQDCDAGACPEADVGQSDTNNEPTRRFLRNSRRGLKGNRRRL